MSQPCTLYRADTQTPTAERRSFQLLARPAHLSIGLMLPIESYAGDAPRLGFYAHVDQDTRRRAEEAGFDLVVPRSRMNREGPALVERLLAP